MLTSTCGCVIVIVSVTQRTNTYYFSKGEKNMSTSLTDVANNVIGFVATTLATAGTAVLLLGVVSGINGKPSRQEYEFCKLPGVTPTMNFVTNKGNALGKKIADWTGTRKAAPTRAWYNPVRIMRG